MKETGHHQKRDIVTASRKPDLRGSVDTARTTVPRVLYRVTPGVNMEHQLMSYVGPIIALLTL